MEILYGVKVESVQDVQMLGPADLIVAADGRESSLKKSCGLSSSLTFRKYRVTESQL